MYDRDGRYCSKFCAECLRLCSDDIAMFICVTFRSIINSAILVERIMEKEPADHARQTLVPWNRLSVITFPALKFFGQVNSRLLRLSLKIKFVDTALRDH